MIGARFSLMITMVFILSGCGTMSNGRGWGQNATLSPGWDRVGKAAYNAAVSPWTWVPAGGAAIFQIDHWDRHVSDWASDKTPVFRSQKNAENWSNYLLCTSGALYGATALLTPSGDQGGEWITNKMKGFIVGGGALGLTEAGIVALKEAAKRERPNGSGDDSFPSAHAAGAASFATLAAKNVSALELPWKAQAASDVGLGLVALGTAWARVEAKKHYPSDVLAGMALGHFISSFVNDAFLGIRGLNPEANISRNGFYLGARWDY
jgi:membrane-associated phospholipid phosphatase